MYRVIEQMTNLTSLFVDGYRTRHEIFSGETQRLTLSVRNLVNLRIFKCKDIHHLPYPLDLDGIGQLTNLTILKMPLQEHSRHDLRFLSNLTQLALYSSRSSDNASCIHNHVTSALQNLSKLVLRGDIYFAGLSEMTKLTHLKIERNDFQSDTNIQTLSNLTHLKVALTPGITYHSISNLTNLSTLACEYYAIPATSNLPNLTKLDIQYVYGLNPENLARDYSISKLTNLVSLTYQDQFSLNEDDLKALVNLRELDLGFNDVAASACVKYLTNLQSLKCNQMIDDRTIHHLSNLRYLDVSKNYNISDYGIEKLTNLMTLICPRNRYISNDGISKLINLTHLNISGISNQFITLKGIQGLTNLLSLKCRNNLLPVWDKRNFPFLRNITFDPSTEYDNDNNERMLPYTPPCSCHCHCGLNYERREREIESDYDPYGRSGDSYYSYDRSENSSDWRDDMESYPGENYNRMSEIESEEIDDSDSSPRYYGNEDYEYGHSDGSTSS